MVNWFIDDQRNRQYDGPVLGWTECVLNINEERQKTDKVFWSKGPVCLRAHPNFQSKGPWYDWVLVNFEMDDGEKALYPCKILSFFQDPIHGEPQALVHASDYKDEEKNGDSVICGEWFLEYDELTVSVPNNDGNESSKKRKERRYFPRLRAISVDCIVRPIFVIQELPGIQESLLKSSVPKFYNRCVVVSDREEEWWYYFTESRDSAS